MNFERLHRQMVLEQLKLRGITDERVLTAFLKVPRHEFVPPEGRSEAYADHPVPIGGGQTISQPYIVALTLEALRLQGHERVLEVGTGSGYQLALLAELALEAYSVERIPELAHQAMRRLEAMGAHNLHVTVGNGSLGWPEHAPYDGIVVAAAAPAIPPELLAQLAPAGRMVLPIGGAQAQILTLVQKRGEHLERRELTGFVFVPLIGEHGWPSA